MIVFLRGEPLSLAGTNAPGSRGAFRTYSEAPARPQLLRCPLFSEYRMLCPRCPSFLTTDMLCSFPPLGRRRFFAETVVSEEHIAYEVGDFEEREF